jgi:predicted RNA methylase
MWLVIIAVVIVGIGFVVFKGAPYVPSKRRDIERAFTELYALGDKDILVDIGSGDGVVLRVASSKGAHAIGYELHPLLVWLSKFLSRNDENVMVVLANFWNVEMPANTTVVYTFGDARDIQKMYDKVAHEATRIDHSLKFISYGFEVPGISPEKTVGAHHLYMVHPLQ